MVVIVLASRELRISAPIAAVGAVTSSEGVQSVMAIMTTTGC